MKPLNFYKLLCCSVVYLLMGLGSAWSYTLSGTIYAGSTALSGASVALTNASNGSSAGTVTTGSDGLYSFTVYAGTYNLVVTPPSSANLSPSHINGVAVSNQDVSQDVVLILATTPWIGVVRGVSGVALPGAKIDIRDLSDKTILAITTDANGAFKATVSPGYYKIYTVADKQSGVRVAGLPSYFYFEQVVSIPIGGLQKDIQIPFVEMKGKVTDANGVGVSGVTVAVNGRINYYQTAGDVSVSLTSYTINSALSDSGGNYAIWLYPTGVDDSGISFTVTPTTNSNFSISAIDDFKLTTSKLLNVILPFKDIFSPIITSGPILRSVTSNSAVVEWQTDEPTTGSVKVGNITAVATDLATTHSIQVSGLTASTAYNVEVSAVDKASNGPTLKTGSFTSASAADTKPPIILEGPTVFNSTNNSLVVLWVTNEPSKGSLTYGTASTGTGSTITESALSVVHRVELTGLASNTQYYVRASATDAAGNGPTLSRIGTGRTLGSADSVAPVITNGPLIYDIQSDKATVRWKTDKPTNSGVSWNDGTAYGVLTDPLYVIDHSQQATGLIAGKTYYLTVSSTDALGNGPTLSKTVEFTTLPAAQTSAPQVLAQPQIVSVTNTTAVVTWPTDQPSTSEVSYGTSANSLTQAENRANLTTNHSVPLVGLSPNTTYVVQVNSKNVGGKSSVNVYPSSQTTSLGFKTSSSADTQQPAFSTPPTVGYATDKQAVVQWKTDKMADSVVTITSLTFDEPPRIKSDGALNDQHEISLTGLKPSNKYSVSVTSTDLSGNTTTTVMPEFTTPPQPDSSKPQILQAPTVQTTASTATVSWTTDKLSDSQVSYGTTSLSQVAGDISFTKQHKVVLGNLNAATNYQVKVVSTDPSGNSTQAATTSFTTNNADGSSNTSSTTTTSTSTTSKSSTTTTVATTTSTSTSTIGGGVTNTTVSSPTTTTTLKLNVSLAQGWNLIGNGAEQSINVSSVFGDTSKFTTVWKWVASATKWAFYTPSLNSSQLATYATSKGYDVLSTVNAGEGVWVNAALATSVNLQSSLTATLAPVNAGSFQTGATKALASGWSLISIGDNKTPTEFNAALSATPPTIASTLPTNLTTLWAWDAQDTNWMFFAPSLVNNGTLSSYISSKNYLNFGTKPMTPAMGFWVNKP